MAEEDFVDYYRIQNVEARPYVPGEDVSAVTMSESYTPQEGDMIARNPRDRDTLFLIPKDVFVTTYETFTEARGVPKTQAKPAGTRAKTKEEF
jgi:hypothetical protein